MEALTRLIECASEAVQKTVKISHILKEVIKTFEEEPDIYRKIPALICLAKIIMHDSMKIRAAEDDELSVPEDIYGRFEQARKYLKTVAGAQDNSGEAMGFIINALIVASRPESATQEQINIWGCELHMRGGKNVDIKPLLPVWAVVKIMEKISQLEFNIGNGNRQSGSQSLRAIYQQTGTPDGNGICALLSAADEGTLTHLNCVETFMALRRESAVFSQTPEIVRSAVRRQMGITRPQSDTEEMPKPTVASFQPAFAH